MTYYGELENLAIKAKVIASVFFLFLITSEIAFLSIKVSGAEYGVGEIRKWNWARYMYLINYEQKNWPNATGYDSIINQLEAGYKKIEVKNVLDTTVSFSITTYDRNGTILPGPIENKSGDVQTGEGVEFYIIAGFLNEGDPITIKEDAQKINRTRSEVYANASRVINQAEFSKSNIPDAYTMEISRFQIAWDRRTGLVCEMMLESSYYKSETGDYPWTEDYIFTKTLMIETDLWNPERGMDWSGPAVGLTIFSLLVITVFFVRHRKRNKARIRIQRH